MARNAALQAENRQLAERVIKLEEELVLARLHRFAPRSEKTRDRILNEAEQIAAEDGAGDDAGDGVVEAIPVVGVPDTGLPEIDAAPRSKRGRKALPASLPRERVEYDLADDQKACPCCSNRMHRMGETVTEQLHIEVKAKVLQNVRFKYACRHCDRTGITTPVVMAPMPRQPLPRQYRHGLDASLRARSQICRRHTTLPPGAGLRARRCSCQPGGSGPLGDRRKRKASEPHL